MLAGLAVGLCLAKVHFLVFLPLLLLRRRCWHVWPGFSIAAKLAILVNFLVQPDWISLYWRALHMPQESMNSTPKHIPNFYSVFFGTGHPEYGMVLGMVIVTIALWPICRHLPFELAMPFCILGGVLPAPHINKFESILTIPAFSWLRDSFLPCGLHLFCDCRPRAASFICLVPSAGNDPRRSSECRSGSCFNQADFHRIPVNVTGAEPQSKALA